MATKTERSDNEQVLSIRQERNNQIVIVTAGKRGVGKSALINSFLGLEGPEASLSHLQPTSATDSVALYDQVMGGVNLCVIDVALPGLLRTYEDKAKNTSLALTSFADGKTTF